MTTGCQYLVKLVFSSGRYPEVGLLKATLVPLLMFGGTSALCPTAAALVFVPTDSAGGSLFSGSPPTSVLSCLLQELFPRVGGHAPL